MAMSTGLVDTDIHPRLDARSVGARLPEPWRTRYFSGNRGPGHLGYWNPNGVMRSDTKLPDGTRIEDTPENLVAHFLEPYGIEYGVLCPAGALHIGLSPEPDYAAAVVAAENDELAERWLPASDRLRGSLIVAPHDPERAAEEIRRHAGTPGMAQVLMPSGSPMGYGRPFFHPIYAAACDAGLPVAIHPGTEGVGISAPPTATGYPTSYLEWHTDLVTSYIGHLVSLLVEGVFVRFPELRFVLIEGGVAWLPPLLWRLDKNWRALRQQAPWLQRAPSEYAYEHVLLTTQPIEEPDQPQQLHALLEMFPADAMLMFSSDFPHWDGDTPDFVTGRLPGHLRADVMSHTARRLYRLPERADG